MVGLGTFEIFNCFLDNRGLREVRLIALRVQSLGGAVQLLWVRKSEAMGGRVYRPAVVSVHLLTGACGAVRFFVHFGHLLIFLQTAALRKQ